MKKTGSLKVQMNFQTIASVQQAKSNEVGLTEDATISSSFHSLHKVKNMEEQL